MSENQPLLKQLEQLLRLKRSRKFYAERLGITESEVANLMEELRNGEGKNAEAESANYISELEDVIVTSRGEGYTYIDLEVVGDGTNANVYADLSVGDLETNQSTVELSAISGAIYNVKIYNAQLTDSQVLQNYRAVKGRFGF
jgi:hypothetical protein